MTRKNGGLIHERAEHAGAVCVPPPLPSASVSVSIPAAPATPATALPNPVVAPLNANPAPAFFLFSSLRSRSPWSSSSRVLSASDGRHRAALLCRASAARPLR